MSKQSGKLNEILGIADNTSIDDYLKEVDIEEVKDNFKTSLTKFEDDTKNINHFLQEEGLSDKAFAVLETKLTDSLNSIDELVTLSKEFIKQVYEYVESTELIDSETIQSAASLIESCRSSIREYLEIYRDRMEFYDKMRLEFIRHKFASERMKLKHEYDLEKIQTVNSLKTNTLTLSSTSDGYVYNQSKILTEDIQ